MNQQINEFPVLPLRDVVVYPNMVIPLFVGRKKSIAALEYAMETGKQILLVAQKNAAENDPLLEDIYSIGTISNILQLLKLPDGTIKVLVEGSKRAVVEKFSSGDDFYTSEASTPGVGVDLAFSTFSMNSSMCADASCSQLSSPASTWGEGGMGRRA